MKLGITPLRVEKIISIANEGKGLEGFSNFKFSDLVEEAAQIGFKHLEITSDLFQALPISVNEGELSRLKKIKNRYNITYSMHLPIMSIELASPNNFIREGSINSLIYAFNSFKPIEKDIDIFVIHPTGAFTSEIMDMEVEQSIRNYVKDLFIPVRRSI